MYTEAINKKIVAAVVFAVTFIFYALTVGPYTYWQDTGIYLSAIKDFGIPPTTGFPLHMLISKLATIVFTDLLGLDFVMVVSLVSAFCSATASAVIALIVYEFITLGLAFYEKGAAAAMLSSWGIGTVVCPIVAGISFGLGFYPWSQALNGEVYSMAIMFIMGAYYLIFRLGRLGRFSDKLTNIQVKYLFWIALLSGCSFSTHLMMSTPLVATYVFMLVVNWRVFKQWKILVMFSATLIASYIVPHLYFLLIPQYNSYFQFADISTAKGFFYWIFAFQWGGDPVGWFYLPWDRFATFFRLFYEEYFVFGTIFVLIGQWKLFRLNKRLAGFIFMIYMVELFTAWAYLRGSEYDMWMITGYALLSIPLGAGLYTILQLVAINLRNILLSAASLLIIAPMVIVNYPLLDRKSYPYAEELARNILKNVDPNSILMLTNDADVANAFYLQIVRGYRTDVTILMKNYLWEDWYRTHLKTFFKIELPKKTTGDYSNDFYGQVQAMGGLLYQLNYPDIRDMILNDVIYLNTNRPFFTRDYLKFPLKNGLKLIPAGGLWKVVKDDVREIDLKYWEYDFSDKDFYKREQTERLLGQLYRRVPRSTGQVDLFIRRRTYISELIGFKASAHKSLANWYVSVAERYMAIKDDDKNVSGVKNKENGNKYYKMALREFEEYVKLLPNHEEAEVYYDMCVLYYIAEEYVKSEQMVNEFRQWYPKMFPEYREKFKREFAHVLTLLGKMYEMKGDTVQANFYYNEAFKIAPIEITQEPVPHKDDQKKEEKK
ncbi:MAG: DUF2723 domain-containing protein [Planctomycetes bacterium]|nr:DUF2723 domain-containing protein [Planctomycetota bacterium]